MKRRVAKLVMFTVLDKVTWACVGVHGRPWVLVGVVGVAYPPVTPTSTLVISLPLTPWSHLKMVARDGHNYIAIFTGFHGRGGRRSRPGHGRGSKSGCRRGGAGGAPSETVEISEKLTILGLTLPRHFACKQMAANYAREEPI